MIEEADLAPPPARDPQAALRWALPDRTLDLQGPLVMGVLNRTPDSFSDGGELRSLEAAVERAEAMISAGAAVLDVGGESTRPGAEEVAVGDEIARVTPLIERIAPLGVPVSIDTRKAEVARAALDAGAVIVNDVSGLRFDPEMAGVVAEARAGLVLMHMRGDPHDMAEHAVYDDLTGEIVGELRDALEGARKEGVEEERVVVDPGIGFAKDAAQSLRLLERLADLSVLGRPILVGPSRKSFLGRLLGVPPEERLAGTLAACVLAFLAGARIFRVHDVQPVVEALTVARAAVELR